MISKIKKAIKQKKICVSVISVAKSGMSRRVKFFIAVDSEIVDITHHLEIISNSKSVKNKDLYDEIYNAKSWNYEGIRLSGCGVDTIAYFLYELGKKWFNDYTCSSLNYRIL